MYPKPRPCQKALQHTKFLSSPLTASSLHCFLEFLFHLDCKGIICQNIQADESVGLACSESLCMRKFGSCSFTKEDGMGCILGSYIKDCLNSGADVAAAPKVPCTEVYVSSRKNWGRLREEDGVSCKDQPMYSDTYELPTLGYVMLASAVESIVFGVMPRYWIMYCLYCSASVSFVTMSS